MATYAVWKSIKHYMVASCEPAKVSHSDSELDSWARDNGWYQPRAVVCRLTDKDEWWPVDWVMKSQAQPLPEDQPVKYFNVRHRGATWPTILGPAPTDLQQI